MAVSGIWSRRINSDDAWNTPPPRFFSKKLAMDVRGEQYAWAAHYLCEMGKAVVDDLTQAMTPSR